MDPKAGVVINWKRLFWLARERKKSPEAYRALQAFQGMGIIGGLAQNGVHVAGQQVLDLGCGFGGFAQALKDSGAQVVALDSSARVLKGLSRELRPVCGDALRLPFPDGSFDFVFCASLIEHVPDPHRLFGEIRRVLRDGGWCYLSFPPFYSPRGGHQFAPYHLLGERFATWVYCRSRAKRVPTWQREFLAEGETYRRAFKGFGLHKVTIASAKKWIAESGLETTRISTRFSKVNPASWPVIGEFLTWNVEFLLRKRP